MSEVQDALVQSPEVPDVQEVVEVHDEVEVNTENEDDDDTEEEIVIFPKECRLITKNRILPTEEEIEYILRRWGVDIHSKCSAKRIARINDQRYAWKAINFQQYLCHLKTGMGSYHNAVNYRTYWFDVNVYNNE